MANKVVIYGGRGALGAAIVKHFQNQNYVSAYFICYPTYPSKLTSLALLTKKLLIALMVFHEILILSYYRIIQ